MFYYVFGEEAPEGGGHVAHRAAGGELVALSLCEDDSLRIGLLCREDDRQPVLDAHLLQFLSYGATQSAVIGLADVGKPYLGDIALRSCPHARYNLDVPMERLTDEVALRLMVSMASMMKS
jgi:hypothetical protein